jgi:hypothetical protein
MGLDRLGDAQVRRERPAACSRERLKVPGAIPLKVSVAWLREMVVDRRPAGAELAHSLTMAGARGGGDHPGRGDFSGIVVGHVKSVAPHPECRQAARDRGRRGHWRGPHDRVRGRPTWPRAEGPVRADRREACPGPGDQEGEAAWRRIERHAVLGARAGPVAGPRGAAGPGSGRSRGPRRARGARPRRYLPHAQAHAQPRRLPVDARHRTRCGGDPRGGAQASRGSRGDQGDRRCTRDPDQRTEGLRPILRARDSRNRPERAHAGVDGAAPGAARDCAPSDRWWTSPTT